MTSTPPPRAPGSTPAPGCSWRTCLRSTPCSIPGTGWGSARCSSTGSASRARPLGLGRTAWRCAARCADDLDTAIMPMATLIWEHQAGAAGVHRPDAAARRADPGGLGRVVRPARRHAVRRGARRPAGGVRAALPGRARRRRRRAQRQPGGVRDAARAARPRRRHGPGRACARLGGRGRIPGRDDRLARAQPAVVAVLAGPRVPAHVPPAAPRSRVPVSRTASACRTSGRARPSTRPARPARRPRGRRTPRPAASACSGCSQTTRSSPTSGPRSSSASSSGTAASRSAAETVMQQPSTRPPSASSRRFSTVPATASAVHDGAATASPGNAGGASPASATAVRYRSRSARLSGKRASTPARAACAGYGLSASVRWPCFARPSASCTATPVRICSRCGSHSAGNRSSSSARLTVATSSVAKVPPAHARDEPFAVVLAVEHQRLRQPGGRHPQGELQPQQPVAGQLRPDVEPADLAQRVRADDDRRHGDRVGGRDQREQRRARAAASARRPSPAARPSAARRRRGRAASRRRPARRRSPPAPRSCAPGCRAASRRRRPRARRTRPAARARPRFMLSGNRSPGGVADVPDAGIGEEALGDLDRPVGRAVVVDPAAPARRPPGRARCSIDRARNSAPLRTERTTVTVGWDMSPA